MNPASTIAYIGLGSNLGDRYQNLQDAIDAMKHHAIQICAISPLYETTPEGVQSSQPNYLNAVARINTSLGLNELHTLTYKLEHNLGRRDKGLRKPRTIDLDILLYGQEQCLTDSLEVPHPRMLERQFVLIPLSDVLTSGWPHTFDDIELLCKQYAKPLNKIKNTLNP